MEPVKHGIDTVTAAAVLASLVHAIPDVLSWLAAAMSALWYGIRIYEWWKSKRKA